MSSAFEDNVAQTQDKFKYVTENLTTVTPLIVSRYVIAASNKSLTMGRRLKIDFVKQGHNAEKTLVKIISIAVTKSVAPYIVRLFC
jgi:hypothetical protein